MFLAMAYISFLVCMGAMAIGLAVITLDDKCFVVAAVSVVIMALSVIGEYITDKR